MVAHASPAIERAYTLTLTPAGKAVMVKLRASAVAHEREIDRLVGRTNRPELIRTLKRIIAGLAEGDDR